MNLRDLTLALFKGSATSALRAARGTLVEAVTCPGAEMVRSPVSPVMVDCQQGKGTNLKSLALHIILHW